MDAAPAPSTATTTLAVAPDVEHAADAAALDHLEQLEAESIHIIREAVAESDNPVLLYSIGKDSSVLLHLALQGVLSGASRRSRCCTSIRPGNSAR